MEFTQELLAVSCRRFLAALRFLTIVPIDWMVDEDADYFRDCLPFFPVIGFLIGIVAWLLSHLLLLFFPQQLVSAFLIFYLAAISGFLHLDGLSDSADGLLSARPKEKALAIMKDSRAGAMGVVAVVFLLLIKYAALSSVNAGLLSLTVFFMPVIGRCAILILMATQQYGRSEGGLGSYFYSSESKKIAVTASLIIIILFMLLSPLICIFFAVIFTVVFFLFRRWCQIRLGGATGDTLGAVCEISEMITAIVFTISYLFL